MHTFVFVVHLISRDINSSSSVRQREVSVRDPYSARGIPSVQTALTDNLRRGGKELGSKKCFVFFSSLTPVFPLPLIFLSQYHSCCSLETVDIEEEMCGLSFGRLDM